MNKNVKLGLIGRKRLLNKKEEDSSQNSESGKEKKSYVKYVKKRNINIIAQDAK